MNTQVKPTIPAINQPWPEQGGIYVGTRLIDGVVHHVIAANGTQHDIKKVPFANVETVIPAELDGQSDWRAPDKEDLLLAYINSREHFEQKGMASLYWSRTVSDNYPWAVDFEYGLTLDYRRRDEFRVRPFRSFPDSSL